MGKSQEVKDFVSGFTAGFKMMDDSIYKQALADYYRGGGKGGKGNRFGLSGSSSDDKPNFLQRLFGAEEKKYESAQEEGMANLQRMREQAVREGNATALKKIDQEIVDFGKIHGVKAGGGAVEPRVAPSGNITPKATAPATSRTDGGSPAGDSGGVAGGALKEPANPPTVPSDPPKNPPITKISADGSDENPRFEDAALSTGASDDLKLDRVGDTYFSDGPDWGFELAGGGFIDQLNEQEAPPPAIPDTLEPENAPYMRDYEGDFQEDDFDYHEDEASLAVTQNMAQAAAPGIDAGLRLMQAKFAPQAGLPDADPNVAKGANGLARNDGAATQEEVAAIDKVVDPEGKLPASAKSAARIAAVWDFYSKTDPDKAADMAQRLMLYDKQNSQTRGMIALQAIEQGNYGAAVRVIQDSFNNDIAGGGLIQKAVLRDDGNVDVTARTNDGPTTFTAPKEEIVKVASDMAKGTAYMQQTVDNSARALAAVTKPKAQRTAVADEDAAREYMTAKIRLRQAIQSNDKSAIEKAQADLAAAENNAVEFAVKQKNPEKSLRAMGINPNAPLPKPQAPPKAPPQPKLPTPTAEERAQMREALAVDDANERLRRVGSVVQSGLPVDGRRVMSADDPNRLSGQGTYIDDQGRVRLEKNRGTTAIGDVDPRDLSNSGSMPGYGNAATGYRRSEGAAVEGARRSAEPVRAQYERDRAALGYKQAGTIGTPGSYDDAMSEEGGFAKAASALKKANGEPALGKAEKETLLRQAYTLSKKNDLAPAQIVEFLYNAQHDATKPIVYDQETGRVQIGNNKVFVDSDTLTDIARARGELRARYMADERSRMKQDAENEYARQDQIKQKQNEKAKAEAREESRFDTKRWKALPPKSKQRSDELEALKNKPMFSR